MTLRGSCADLIVESITLPASPGFPAGTVISGTGGHVFSAVIKNKGGEETAITFYNSFSVNNALIRPTQGLPINKLGAGMSSSVSSDFWTADSVVSSTLFPVKVCADNKDGRTSLIDERNADASKAEDNNCLTVELLIIPPLNVTLEASKAGVDTYKQNYVIIEYEDRANLRWSVTGSPKECSAVSGTDLSGKVANESYTITGNPLSLKDLIDKF